MTTAPPKLPNEPRAAAAYWFARVHSGNFTVAEREHFHAWRQADASNAQEYRALDEIWQAANLVPEAELRELLEAPESPGERQRRVRRRWMVGVGAGCAVAVAAGVFGNRHLLDGSEQVLHYSTAPGARRTETLPDGSVIEMNVATQLIVRYYRHRRQVELIDGEVSFDVAGNRDRPFFVTAGDVDVRVTGTVFNVRRERDHVSVAVQSGEVSVSSGRWWARNRATLAAGMMATALRDQSLRIVTQADVATLTAWRQGKVVFRDQPLEDVVREMNRYLARSIHIKDDRLRRLNMTGVFGIDNAEGFLQALQAHLPVVTVQRPDGGVNLALRR